MELKGKAYLRRKLDGYRTGVQTRYKYYSMEKFDNTDGITIPAQISNWIYNPCCIACLNHL